MAAPSLGVVYGGQTSDTGRVPTDGPRSVPEDLMPTDHAPTRHEQLLRLMQMMQRGNAAKMLKMHMLNVKGDRDQFMPSMQGTLSGGDMSGEGK